MGLRRWARHLGGRQVQMGPQQRVQPTQPGWVQQVTQQVYTSATTEQQHKGLQRLDA